MTVVAAGAAKVGGRQLLAAHGSQLQVTFKADAGNTPQTLDDVRSGQTIKNIIHKVLPAHRVNEEETGVLEGVEYSWHVDPFDGTSSLIEGQRYSTTGISVSEGDRLVVGVICHPFERELIVAEAGKGAFLFPLNERLEIAGPGQRLEVSKKQTLNKGIVYLDALFNGKTTAPKTELMQRLVELSGNDLGFRMTGSNIDQERQVAAGRGTITITDAVGGFWDLSAGALIIKEAGGIMLDGQTGEPVTEKTQVAIGGPEKLVREVVLPVVQECYASYAGFK